MFKTLTTLGLMALLIMGCTGPRSTPVTPASEAEASQVEASSIPTVHLESSGSSVQGLEIASSWVDAAGLGGGGATPMANPLTFPGVLDVQAGQSIAIVVTADSPVSALLVTELTMDGVPMVSSVLKPTTSATLYSPTAVVHFVLQVTAQQSWQQNMTYLFEVNVTPVTVDRQDPESVLRAYFDAWERSDWSAQASFMDENYAGMEPEPVDLIRILQIQPVLSSSLIERTYHVIFEIQVKGQGVSMHNGRYDWSYYLTWDATRSSWLISNYGAG
jgi:hypothetical protein